MNKSIRKLALLCTIAVVFILVVSDIIPKELRFFLSIGIILTGAIVVFYRLNNREPKYEILKRVIALVFFFGIYMSAQSQHLVDGFVQDSINLESLPYAAVAVESSNIRVVTDAGGLFKLSLPSGKYKLIISYIGYETGSYQITVPLSSPLICRLQRNSTTIDDAVIYDKKANEQITNMTMGMVALKMENIRRIPAFLGEVDIIKSMQLLPGVTSTSEGSSGFSVRGGAPDQNLVILENAPILSTSHAMGFFPLFNNDAINNVTIYKGDIPVEYGNRLSSILDIELNDGGMQEYNVSGGIGLLSTRLSIDGPIIKDKLSFFVSARRSYFDLFLAASSDKMLQSTRMYFWDLSGKLTYDINYKNKLTFSSYASNDMMKMSMMGIQATYGNRLVSLAWNHEYNQKWHSELSASYIKYLCGFNIESSSFKLDTETAMQNASIKYDINYKPNKNNHLTMGLQSTLHVFDPGSFSQIIGGESGFVTDNAGESIDLSTSTILPRMYGVENALYIGNTQKIGQHFSLKYGLRTSSFSNIGSDKVFSFGTNFNVLDTVQYGKREIYHTDWSLEPRIGLNVVINDANSIKMNYSRTAQYVQLAQNTAAGLPQDRWFSVNPNLEPQFADMFALGYFRNFYNNSWEASIEGYYKKMSNVIDFKDFAQLMVNEQMYGELRTGKGWAAGLEFLLKRTEGRFNGWISYTLSRTMRQIDGINEGRPYLSPYDRTHNFSIVLNYELSKRVDLAATWVYYTGTPYTVPIGKAEIEGETIPVYSDRNAFRLPDYHRLDLSMTLRPKYKPKRRFDYDFNIGLYNVYNQHNAWFISFKSEEDKPLETYAELSYLFGFIPSVTFNFHF